VCDHSHFSLLVTMQSRIVILSGSLPRLAESLRQRDTALKVMIVSNACCEIAARRHITSSTPAYWVVNTNEIPLASIHGQA